MTDMPELGNIAFGHSRGEFRVPREWQDKFFDLVDAIDPNDGCYCQNYENDIFLTMRYWWGDCDCGLGTDIEPLAHLSACSLLKPNFLYKPTGYEISWYKYPLRDSWSNFQITLEQFEDIIAKCVESVRKDEKVLRQIAICQTPELNYMAAHTDAKCRMKNDQRQVFCKICQRWKWPDRVCIIGKT